MRGIRATLGAAAVDADAAASLRAGRLIEEPEAPSLEQLLGSLPQRPAGDREGQDEGACAPRSRGGAPGAAG